MRVIVIGGFQLFCIRRTGDGGGVAEKGLYLSQEVV
jgi:hypothetical protein